MTVTVPEWLTKRGGGVRPGSDGQTWFVVFDGQPHYRLAPVPAGGKYSCHVTQTENGRRRDGGLPYPTVVDAIHGGLEELRQALGW
jgi:hypothetical protein